MPRFAALPFRFRFERIVLLCSVRYLTIRVLRKPPGVFTLRVPSPGHSLRLQAYITGVCVCVCVCVCA